MKVTADNLFANISRSADTEQFTSLLRGGSFRCERIVSWGHATPPGEWYDQPQHEWVMLLSGSACLRIDGESAPRELRPGDWVILPARIRHRVESTDATLPTVWLAVHYQADDVV